MFLHHLIKPRSFHRQNAQNLWTYVAKAFNTVDPARLQQVGPDRLCAEWVLKNSGAVTFTDGCKLRDYNSLPPENVRLELRKIDATDSSIMKDGLEHLKGCRKIDSILIVRCKHLEDGGLEGLIHVKDSIRELEVIDCQNLMDSCLMVIKELRKLENLKISNLRYVKNMKNVEKELIASLPNCKIDVT